MDGIFGVGLAEMLIIGLALFVVGGPKNTAKWAREMGKMVRQVRQALPPPTTHFRSRCQAGRLPEAG